MDEASYVISAKLTKFREASSANEENDSRGSKSIPTNELSATRKRSPYCHRGTPSRRSGCIVSDYTRSWYRSRKYLIRERVPRVEGPSFAGIAR